MFVFSYTKSIKWYCPFEDIFSLDEFWSPMFKYLMGVFLRANNKYHTSFIMYTHIGFQISFQSISKYNHDGFKVASIVCSASKDGHVGLNNNYCAKASQGDKHWSLKRLKLKWWPRCIYCVVQRATDNGGRSSLGTVSNDLPRRDKTTIVVNCYRS